MYILKYNLISLSNRTCRYVFRADNLVMHSQFVCSSFKKMVSPALRIPLKPVVLCVVMRPHSLSPVHSGMFIFVTLV